jgi:hypothetical protein
MPESPEQQIGDVLAEQANALLREDEEEAPRKALRREQLHKLRERADLANEDLGVDELEGCCGVCGHWPDPVFGCACEAPGADKREVR